METNRANEFPIDHRQAESEIVSYRETRYSYFDGALFLQLSEVESNLTPVALSSNSIDLFILFF